MAQMEPIGVGGLVCVLNGEEMTVAEAVTKLRSELARIPENNAREPIAAAEERGAREFAEMMIADEGGIEFARTHFNKMLARWIAARKGE